MHARFRVYFVALFFLFILSSCSKPAQRAGEAGLEVPSAGIKVVATYDRRFDRMLEKYRLVSITFLNQSPNVIRLDDKKDVWTVTTKSGRKVQAINSLQTKDPEAFGSLSMRAQELIDYPGLVMRNTTVTFDLIFPKTVDLVGFRQIEFSCHSLAQTFTAGPSQELEKE